MEDYIAVPNNAKHKTSEVKLLNVESYCSVNIDKQTIFERIQIKCLGNFNAFKTYLDKRF